MCLAATLLGPSRFPTRGMSKPAPLLEICIDDLSGARAALADGADRLEVCARLDLDGLSPGPGLLTALRAETDRPLYAMVRPRATDFVLQPGELDEMRRDLDTAVECGANGAVLGALTAKSELPDQELGALLDGLPAGFACTFHRAFDRALSPHASIATLGALGFTRVLTSGRPGKAVDHLPLLHELVTLSKALPIAVLPGGGVRPHNAEAILSALGVTELHSSATRGWADWRAARRA